MSNDEKGLDDATCDRCGRKAAVKVGERFFCEDCYQTAGSCCPEFGGDDIWEFDDSRPPPEKEES